MGLLGGPQPGIFPLLDAVLADARKNPAREAFINAALADTDRRVSEDKPVAPSFLLACLLWHEVLAGWQRLKAQGEPAFPALQQAIDAVFDARIGDISGRGKLGADMREIWMMQPRFDRRSGNTPAGLVEQPRFRAAFDFLRLRADTGEVEAELAEWWEDYSLGDDEERRALLDQAREQEHERRASGGGASSSSASSSAEPAAKKRRRRRRKPAGEGGAAPAPAQGAPGGPAD